MAFIAVFSAYLFFYFDLWAFFSDKERLARYIGSYGGLSILVLIVIQIIQVLAAPLPGEITGFAGGFVFGAVKGTLWSTIGLTLGSWLAFAVGRWSGRPVVERIVKADTLAHYDDVITHGGKKVVFILYLIPGFPKDLLCYILGMSGLGVRDFLVLSTAGRFFGTVGLSVAGGLVRAERYGEFLVVSLVMGVIVLVSYLNREKILHPIRWKRQRAARKVYGTSGASVEEKGASVEEKTPEPVRDEDAARTAAGENVKAGDETGEGRAEGPDRTSLR